MYIAKVLIQNDVLHKDTLFYKEKHFWNNYTTKFLGKSVKSRVPDYVHNATKLSVSLPNSYRNTNFPNGFLMFSGCQVY